METVRIITRVILGTGMGKRPLFLLLRSCPRSDSREYLHHILVIGIGYAGLRCRLFSIASYRVRGEVLLFSAADQSKSAEQMYQARRKQVDPVPVL